MSEKSNDTPQADGSSQTGPAASSAGRPVTSPYDSPTTQMPKPDLHKDIPRTDEDLGLDPGDEVPTASAAHIDGKGDDGYGYAATIPPAAAASAGTVRLQRRNREPRRGTLDLGLFVLRLVVGYTFIYHGLQKLTGWFHGPGLDGTKTMMESGGWDYPSLATALVIAGELGGGILLVLGLATPLAAGAVLATILNAWMWKQGMVPGFQYNAATPTGVEIDSILAGASLAIILTGPGRWSFDRARGWATRPAWGSFTVVLLAVAAAIATYWFLHGGNPLKGIGPFS
ncbi:DoxX family protein [Nocardia rhizosphaerihabitans]|uniref:Membrane protein n=1 Tax=Nocardia rhizosphaerihabitans TaxID=1691570 RepID=A0ABQ2K607_9NOCA|nr:DoxX family protein [Nocardia rhizosphaerihabitans]GGN71727.1 membrane protein [Nocardia rhizosphaerihabitans]